MKRGRTRLYRIKVHNFPKKYLLAELVDMFITPDQYQFVDDDDKEFHWEFNKSGNDDRNEIKRQLFNVLAAETRTKLPWGILTGIRPVKLWGETFEALGKDAANKKMKEFYLLSNDKIELISDIYLNQKRAVGMAPKGSLGLYIGIPFCPSRCSYCSFVTSHMTAKHKDSYLVALLREIEAVGQMATAKELYPESIYIGGGTPTTLEHQQLSLLINKIKEYFDVSKVREWTVEAGRPDTIDEERLTALREAGINRISINPQTTKDSTLKLIGRHHSVEEFFRGYELARVLGFNWINCDLIAGLPGEDLTDFETSLKEVIGLGPENVTIHSLAIKRASRLSETTPHLHYQQGRLVNEMVELSREALKDKLYRPFYLYRQKHQSGNGENVGYCLEGKESMYNMRIMDEHQPILALGAGGISKAYFPEENRLERVANLNSHIEYTDRVEEMIEKKRREFFIMP